MAIPGARAAAAAFGRLSNPAVVSQLHHFAKPRFHPSFRTSGQPFEILSKQVQGMTIPQAIHAKQLVDEKLGSAGIVELTGDDAFRAFREEQRLSNESQRRVAAEHQKLLLQILNKKGDITSIPVGKHGTINLLGVTMLLFKIDDYYPIVPWVGLHNPDAEALRAGADNLMSLALNQRDLTPSAAPPRLEEDGEDDAA